MKATDVDIMTIGVRRSACDFALTASLFCVALFLGSTVLAEDDGLPVATLEDVSEVDFEQQILPIFRTSCLACHNVQEAENDLVLETPQAVIKGGAGGPAVVAGNAAESLLFQLAAHRVEPFMPPEDNDVGAKPLNPRELALLKLWIDQGAKGVILTAPETIEWQPVPQSFAPIYAVAISPHGQLVAAGRGNQIAIYDVAARRQVDRLADESLAQVDGYADAKAAHLDVVQSLAFSPDGEQLASGGFRCVKLWRRAKPSRELAVTLGHRPAAVAIHNSTLAVATPEGEIHIHDLQSGQIAATLKSSSGPVDALSFVRDGTQLLSASLADKMIRNWNLKDGTIIQEVATPASIVAMTVLANDEYVVTAGEDRVLRVRRLSEQTTSDTGNFLALDEKTVREIPAGNAAMIAIVALAGLAQCASASEDGVVRIWDVAGGQQLREIRSGGQLHAVAASPSGQRLATLTEDGIAKLWNAADGQLVKQLPHRHQQDLQLADAKQHVELEKQRHQGANTDLEAARKRLADEEKNVTKSDEDVNKAMETAKQKAEAANKPLQDKALAQEAVEQAKSDVADKQKKLDEARQQLDAADDSNRQELEKAKNDEEDKVKQAEQLLKEAEEQLAKRTAEADKAVAESESAEKAIDAAKGAAERGKQVVQRVAEEVASAETVAKQREEAVNQAEASLTTTQESTKLAPSLKTIAFSSDGWRLVASDDAGELHIFSAEQGDFIDAFEAGLAQHVAFDADARAVLTGDDGSVAVWSLDRPWQLESTIGSPYATTDFVDRVTSLAFSPDGDLLATGGGEPSRSGQLKLWRVANGELVADLKDAHSDVIFDLSFSPDGEQLASCGADRMMKLFDVNSGKFLQSFEGHTGHVLGVAWKADGRMLATSGADNVIKVWDAKTGSQNKTIAGFKKEITAIRYLGLEDRIVFSSGDGQVASRNSNGDGRPGFPGASDFVFSVRCSDDGQLVAAGGQDGYVRIWNPKGDKLIEFAAQGEQVTR